MITELTNQMSITATVVALLFTLFHWRVYKYVIIVPLVMSIATLSYGNIDIYWNDILYDISFIAISVILIFSRVNLQLPHKDCFGCSKRFRK